MISPTDLAELERTVEELEELQTRHGTFADARDLLARLARLEPRAPAPGPVVFGERKERE